MKMILRVLLIFFVFQNAFAIDLATSAEEPSSAVSATASENFLPWFWRTELKPTIANSFDSGGQIIFASGVIAVVTARQHDEQIYHHNLDENKTIMDQKTADLGGYIGSGGPGIAIAVAQMFFDQENGIRHGKALVLTAANHITLAALVNRQRPNNQNYLSFPSGHASSSFATATSLAYAYGAKAGIPAFALASFVAASRVNENIHWLSDVVAGAALGIYWGRAAALNPAKESYTILPSYSQGVAGLSFQMDF